MELLISLIGGIIGSYVAGRMLKSFDQGNMINAIVGVVGGIIGIQILAIATAGSIGVNDTQGISTISLLLSGAAGGALLLPAISMIKNIIIK